LQQEGLLTRATDPTDRRAFVVCLTAQGMSEFAKVAKAHERWIRDMFSGLDEVALARLMDDLATLKRSARGA